MNSIKEIITRIKRAWSIYEKIMNMNHTKSVDSVDSTDHTDSIDIDPVDQEQVSDENEIINDSEKKEFIDDFMDEFLGKKSYMIKKSMDSLGMDILNDFEKATVKKCAIEMLLNGKELYDLLNKFKKIASSRDAVETLLAITMMNVMYSMYAKGLIKIALINQNKDINTGEPIEQ